MGGLAVAAAANSAMASAEGTFKGGGAGGLGACILGAAASAARSAAVLRGLLLLFPLSELLLWLW